ncbi:MAG: UvrD-helicase domain-containing protein [bacterium]
MQLNPEQQKAVTTIYGPLLILAGAGSGKTRVLTIRVAQLIEKKIAQPEEILAVTFTNKAAGEMKTRIHSLLKDKVTLPWVGTFHAICLKILKHNAVKIGYDPTFTIYDTNDQLSAIKEIFKKMDISTKQFNPRSIHNQISNAKNELLTPKDYAGMASGLLMEIASKVYPEYQKTLKANSAMDFDDLIMNTVNLLTNNPSILEKYQQLFKFILIDEYQDTNHAQYTLTNLIAAKYKNICVVGDDAQSIYSFRGATIQNILNFEKDYPDTQIIKLEQNYRSTKTILAASNEIIRKNKNQKQKTLWTQNAAGGKITIYSGENEIAEAEWIALNILNLLTKDVDATEIAILYRTNAQSRVLEEAMLRASINYKIVGNVKFYDRKEIKDVMAYLRVLANPKDNLNLKRIINIPRRGIGPKAIAELEYRAAQDFYSIINFLIKPENQDYLSKGMQQFAETYHTLTVISQDTTVEQLIDKVLELSGYLEMLNDGSLENEIRLENIKELKSLAKKYAEFKGREGLQLFLEEVALIEDNNRTQSEQTNAVTLMTIHAAKGLEFAQVFVTGMEEGIFPHSRSFMDPTEMEEERRLAYVAYTRAKDNLYLTHTESRTFFGQISANPLSRFVSDIPKSLVDHPTSTETVSIAPELFPSDRFTAATDVYTTNLAKGDHVLHSHFGEGYVEDLNDEIILVRFSGGTKELSLEYCKLQKINI